MALLNNPLLDFKRNRQFQSLVDVLAESIPENALLQDKLSNLTSSKGSYIKQLIREWESREKPDYDEQEIKQMNIDYLGNQDEEGNDMELRQEGRTVVSSKDWVLKERACWKGYNPTKGKYELKPIKFGGKVEFDTNFLPLVISDEQSKSVNLIQTVKGFLKKGQEMGLGDEDWGQIFLIFSKRFLPLMASSLTRHIGDVDGLFTELCSTINSDHEISKLRNALSTTTRKATEQIHNSLYKIKSAYSMILQISNPNFTDEQCQTKSDHYSVKCVQYLVNESCFKAFQLFTNAKSLENEATSVAEACNFISSQENVGSEFQISATLYLPKSCTQLDLQTLEALNLSDLVISSTNLVYQRRNSGVENTEKNKKRENGTSPNKNKKRDGFSPRRSDSGRYRNWSEQSDSSQGRDRRTSRQGKTPPKGNYSKSRSPSQDRDSRKNDRGGRNRGFKGQGDSKSPERARNDKGRQERSSSRAEGSPMRLQGCLRCSSSNHRASSCTRFQRWEGNKCKICGYLHNSRFCPFAARNQDYRSKDNRSRDNRGEKNLLKDNDNSYRNAYQVQVVKSEDNLQRSDQEEYIPKVPQPTARQNNSSNVFTKN